MPKTKKTAESDIAAVCAAARACGLSYGKYVFLTGGAMQPPETMLLRANPGAKRCPRCNRLYVPGGRHQIYCSPYCRKAAYDERNRKGASQ